MDYFDFDAYQAKAYRFALPTARCNQYLLPGLAGEVGELLSIFAKNTRDGGELDGDAIEKELGDILWFVSAIAYQHSISMADVAEANIKKLESRTARGTITGSGDNR